MKKPRRFLALGGPHDMKRLTSDEAGDLYVRYNASEAGRFFGSRRKKLFSCVLIFKDLVTT